MVAVVASTSLVPCQPRHRHACCCSFHPGGSLNPSYRIQVLVPDDTNLHAVAHAQEYAAPSHSQRVCVRNVRTYTERVPYPLRPKYMQCSNRTQNPKTKRPDGRDDNVHYIPFQAVFIYRNRSSTFYLCSAAHSPTPTRPDQLALALSLRSCTLRCAVHACSRPQWGHCSGCDKMYQATRAEPGSRAGAIHRHQTVQG
jgi:hypothetical protein